MARAIYQDTMSQPDATGFLKVLPGIQIGVYIGGTYGTVDEQPAQIYQSRLSNAEGPAPESAAAGGPNPFVTGASGSVEFWLEAGFYDIRIEDTQVPSRITSRTLQWNAVPAVEDGLPASWLARPPGDDGLHFDAFSDAALRQLVPVGTVVDWWRPNDTVQLPNGWAICKGDSIPADQHDFGTGAAIVLPDLRNKFILGADTARADGLADANAAAAPGIRGVGGAHAVALSVAEMPVHNHGITEPNGGTGHAHSASTSTSTSVSAGGAHSHTLYGGGGQIPVFAGGGNSVWIKPSLGGTGGFWIPSVQNDDYHSWGGAGTDGVGDHGHGASSSSSTTVNKSTTGITINNQGGSGGVTAGHNNVPAYVGLLKIMKVRRF